MSRIINYSTLVSAIVETSEDESTEFANFAPAIVGLAETRVKRELDTDGLVAFTTVAVSASTAEISKPNDYKFAYDLYFTLNDEEKTLVKETDNYLRFYWPHKTSVVSTGPVYYADKDRDAFLIAPCFTSTTDVIIKYQKNIPALTSANNTNYLTSVCPDILFYACMAEAARFKKNWNEIEVWDNMYISSLTALNNEGRRARDDSSDIPYKYAENTLAKEEK